MKNDLQKYRRNKGSRDELEPIIEKEILSDRKLLDCLNYIDNVRGFFYSALFCMQEHSGIFDWAKVTVLRPWIAGKS